jgi:pimeloyl-ACP methyl ester carboxylesterase
MGDGSGGGCDAENGKPGLARSCAAGVYWDVDVTEPAQLVESMDAAMQVLFVHGMGRTSLSGGRLLASLRAQGVATCTFGYVATLQSFASIRERLVARIQSLSADGEYVLIGHSLGGVLLRAAVAALPAGTRQPSRIFLLGSPIKHSRLAHKLHRNWIYRGLTGDCGQLLASRSRMAAIGPSRVPVTCILGVSGWRGRLNPFDGELNDGIVSVSEVSAAWVDEEVRVSALHTYMPSNSRVVQAILARIAHPHHAD